MSAPEPRPGPHTALRPLWLCRTDGQPWPCGSARLALTREYAGQPTALTIHLGSSLAEAFRDLHALNPGAAPEARDLSTRFLGWVRSTSP
ncbi:hypothetical protein ACFP2T_12125 [Plantactinospora solaniradicis]|uniref:Flavin reductase n=1 Tax=Plantactinospora solaniradicis TaxID=1723736 RepID=A0ABW1K637_9ACTN